MNNKLLQLLLLGGGGWLVYSFLMQEQEEEFINRVLDGTGDQIQGGKVVSNGNGTSNGGNRSSSTGNGTVPEEPSLFDQIEAMEIQNTGSNTMNFDQHNWFYTQISGNVGPSPESVGITRTDPMIEMSIATWWSTAGLSGVYLGPSTGLGGAARPSRWERATKQFGV